MNITFPSLDQPWLGMAGSSFALAVARTLATDKRRLFIVTKDSLAAQTLLEQLAVFLDVSQRAMIFPSWELLPYERLRVDASIIAKRLETLHQLLHDPPDICIATPHVLLQRTPPIDFIEAEIIHHRQGDTLNIEHLLGTWQKLGYERCEQVTEPGTFALRGSVIDVFPAQSRQPLRMDLFDSTIEALCLFDPESQLSTKKIKHFDLQPLYEYNLNQPLTHYQARASQLGIALPDDFTAMGDRLHFFLPLLHDQLSSLRDYLHGYHCLLPDDLHSELEAEFHWINTRYQQCQSAHTLAPEHLWQQPEALGDWPAQTRYNQQDGSFATAISNTESLNQLLTTYRCIISNKGLKTTYPLVENLEQALKHTEHCCLPGVLHEPFVIPKAGLAFVNAQQTQSRTPRRGYSVKQDDWAQTWQWKIGDYVVHPEHGIGQLLDSQCLDNNDDEFLKIAFADEGHILMSVRHINRLKPYYSEPTQQVRLDRLGRADFKKRCEKAQKHIDEIASHLLTLHAQQQKSQRRPIDADDDFQAFCESFAFNETPDQTRATQAVVEDATSPYPVHRLLCGDVGFGKTEIMMRAAYLHVCGQEQIIMICPTTLLAEQHMERFTERFQEHAIRIAVLSRFSQAKASQNTLLAFNRGEVDILIGTHKLLHIDINQARVGLVMIDEEHRFGVMQKEHFKQRFPRASFLSASATPIPRSLGMAFGEMMRLSLLSTPPPMRQAVNSHIYPLSKSIIRDAILREIKRGGQVFYVLARIDSLEQRYDSLRQQFPELKIAKLHGQMATHTIHESMQAFLHQHYHVLITTTIIESGIDIPNANTMIVERADQFGLSQLHQLRGRIGRSSKQAYAYFLIPEEGEISDEAQSRLHAINDHQSLGSGFFLANRDMELRGVGELLGKKQSGHIHAIGYHSYLALLQQTMQQNPQTLARPTVTLELKPMGHLPVDWIACFEERLKLYQRLSQVQDESELDNFHRELVDRFGPLPVMAQRLLLSQSLTLIAEKIALKLLREEASHWHLIFNDQGTPHEALINWLQANPSLQVRGSQTLLIKKSYLSTLETLRQALQQHLL